jgi:hypothetical protein
MMRRDNIHDLARLDRVKRRSPAQLVSLGDEMVGFFNQTVRRRQTNLAKFAEAWGALVPESLSDHCALYAFSRGKLTVLVDNATYLYELKQLLLAGLEDQLLLACKTGGLRKIILKPGQPPADEKQESSRARRCRRDAS